MESFWSRETFLALKKVATVKDDKTVGKSNER